MMIDSPRSLRSLLPLAAAPLLVGLLLGCDRKEAPESPVVGPVMAEPTQAPSAAAADARLAALAPDVPKTSPSGLPTPEDFEEEAAASLAPENLEAELDRLEAEILGD